VSGYPVNYEMTARCGSTLKRVLTWKVEEVPVDLTGYTARMQVRTAIDAATVTLEATTDDGVNDYITLGGTAGTITIIVPATVTEDLTAGRYVYDLELENSGEVTALVEGAFVVAPEVTR
jgi:hypothetical protein